MKGNNVSNMLADIVKNTDEAKAFLKNQDQYLSQKGVTLCEQEKWILKGFAEKLLQPSKLQAATSTGTHTNSNTHTNYNASDGHYNWPSHLNHTNSY